MCHRAEMLNFNGVSLLVFPLQPADIRAKVSCNDDDGGNGGDGGGKKDVKPQRGEM